MTSYLLAVALDCHDAEGLADFWCEALGVTTRDHFDDQHGVTYVNVPLGDGVPALVFQPVPESKTVKNRMNLDLAPTTGTQRDEIDRLVSLGARVVDEQPGEEFVVLADPEGNEFCILPHP